MVVFKGHRPENDEEFRKITRGINDIICFYDDLSFTEQMRLDGLSETQINIKKLKRFYENICSMWFIIWNVR